MNFFADEKNTRKIFWGLLSLIFLVMLIITPHYGISGDDVTQWRYGTSVWNYIKTFGEDKTAVTGKYLENTQTLYGGIVDGIAAMLIDIFKPKNEFIVRHYWIMLFGFAGILYTGLVARKLTGKWMAGVLAVIFIVLIPRYFGEVFNNPKDIPFAATYIMALYYSMCWLQHIDAPKWKYTVLLGVAIMLCLGIRIGGLLLLAYFFMAFAVRLWQTNSFSNGTIKKNLVHVVAVLLIGYFGACIWWPYAWEDPISHPYEAFKVMSDYPITLKMLFEGQDTYSTDLPAYYTPKFIAITLPLFALAGVAGCIGLFAANKEFRKSSNYLWLIIFSWAFPVFYIVYKHAVVYDGMRHTLFVLPPIAITSAIFFHYMLERYKEKKAVRMSIVAALVILLALPARYSVANHPNQYVYFNELIGGIKGAYGIYETDYYMNSTKQGYDWLNKNELSKLNGKDTVVIATNCIEPIYQYIYDAKAPLKIVYVRYYEKNKTDWDYGIFFGRFLDREKLQNGYFPGKLAIHNVEADGITLTTVLKNDPERSALQGFEAMSSNDLPTAIDRLNAAAKKDPYDIEVWQYLAHIHMMMKNYPEAKKAIDQARGISTLDVASADMAGDLALRMGDINTSQQIYGELMENAPKRGEGYLGMAKIQATRGDYDLAIQNVTTALELSPHLQQPGFNLLGMIFQSKGDIAQAQKFFRMAQGQ